MGIFALYRNLRDGEPVESYGQALLVCVGVVLLVCRRYVTVVIFVAGEQEQFAVPGTEPGKDVVTCLYSGGQCVLSDGGFLYGALLEERLRLTVDMVVASPT